MTHEQFIDSLFATFLGNIVHLIFKIKSMAKDHKGDKDNKGANLQFSVWGYIKDDKWALLADAAGSFVLVYLGDEWLGELGTIALNKIKSLFFFAGLGGSYVIMQLFGVAKGKFRAAIAYKAAKSDEQDGVSEPTPVEAIVKK